MKTIAIIAWRNLWRNKKRTIITISSILFALLFVILMRSFQVGSYEHMINSMTSLYSGHIQIHADGYSDNKTLDNTFVHSEEIYDKIMSKGDLDYIIPRLESFALASGEERSRPVMVIGTEPEIEDKLTNISRHIIEGRFINTDDKGIVIAKRLADQLRLQLGDDIVLLSQGFMGMSAAGRYPIIGIVDLPMPDLNNRMIMMPLELAQDFYIAENRLTSYVLMLDNIRMTDNFAKGLDNILSDDFEVKTWNEMLIELVQQIQADDIQGLILIWILYIIVAFGIFGTILMMTKERLKEFGVLLAVGMKRIKMSIMVTIEAVIIGIIGILCGLTASLPVLYYFYLNPIRFTGDFGEIMESMGWEPVMPVSFAPQVFTVQIIVIFIIAMIVSIYPVIVISRLKPVEAMKD